VAEYAVSWFITGDPEPRGSLWGKELPPLVLVREALVRRWVECTVVWIAVKTVARLALLIAVVEFVIFHLQQE
jgi:hypothetical protein